MRELAGKTAFVTGGASGIGLALGRAFAQAGMKVMPADIEVDALTAAVGSLGDFGANVQGVTCDVADAASVEHAANTAYAAFGHVHVVCNIPGVAGGSGIDDIPLETWRWVLDVNLMGVLHGIRTFLPHIRAHGEGAHIVNTASLAGLQSGLGFSPYATSKFAVVAMSDVLALAALKEAQARGLAVPGDLSIIGYDDVAEAATSEPPLTTIRQPIAEKGRLAARMIFDPGPPRKEVLAVELVVRGSTAAPRT